MVFGVCVCTLGQQPEFKTKVSQLLVGHFKHPLYASVSPCVKWDYFAMYFIGYCQLSVKYAKNI